MNGCYFTLEINEINDWPESVQTISRKWIQLLNSGVRMAEATLVCVTNCREKDTVKSEHGEHIHIYIYT